MLHGDDDETEYECIECEEKSLITVEKRVLRFRCCTKRGRVDKKKKKKTRLRKSNVSPTNSHDTSSSTTTAVGAAMDNDVLVRAWLIIHELSDLLAQNHKATNALIARAALLKVCPDDPYPS